MQGAQLTFKIEPLYTADARFLTVAAHVVGVNEGGKVNAKADHGGATNMGISLRFLVSEGAIDANHDGFKDYDLDMDGDIDVADINALTSEDALSLYYRCFWRRLDLGRLPVHIDAAVFDQAVNGGAVAAVKLLQKAVNRLTKTVEVDGGLGKATLGAVWELTRMGHADDILERYRQEAVLRYNDIVRADHTQTPFLKGWVARAERLGDV